MGGLRSKSTALEWLAAVIFFSAFIHMGYVRTDFTRRMPVAPDLATHRTEEIAGDHGKHLFVTAEERRRFELAHFAVLAAAGVTLLLIVVARVIRRPAGR